MQWLDADVDVVKTAGRFAFGVAWAATELAVAAYDLITNRDPDAAARRFAAEHPDTIFTITPRPPA